MYCFLKSLKDDSRSVLDLSCHQTAFVFLPAIHTGNLCTSNMRNLPWCVPIITPPKATPPVLPVLPKEPMPADVFTCHTLTRWNFSASHALPTRSILHHTAPSPIHSRNVYPIHQLMSARPVKHWSHFSFPRTSFSKTSAYLLVSKVP